jgi:LacI family transcriptional regulator
MTEPQARPKPLTIRDVARAAGVSTALVSIVFRGAPGASEQTRARVFAVAEQLGYRANRTASLRTTRAAPSRRCWASAASR